MNIFFQRVYQTFTHTWKKKKKKQAKISTDPCLGLSPVIGEKEELRFLEIPPHTRPGSWNSGPLQYLERTSHTMKHLEKTKTKKQTYC